MTRTPAPALTAVLDELDELRAMATPGEWSATDERADGGAYIDADPRPTGCPPPWVGHASRAADAALIVAAVNRLPELTAALRAVLAVHVVAGPCSCGGRRWVEDQGWSPEEYERGRPREEGAGLIPCGFCNHGGWNTEQNEPVDAYCDHDDEAWPCPTVAAITTALEAS